MQGERTYFYKMWHQLIQTQPKSVRLALYDAILEFAFNGTETPLPPKQKQIFDIAKHMIEVSQKRREIQLNRKDFARPLPDLCPTSAEAKAEPEADLFDTSAEPLPDQQLGKNKEKEKVSPPSPSSKNKEKQEGDNACADTDAHALKATAENISAVEGFVYLIPEHLKMDSGFMREWYEWLCYRKRTRRAVSRDAAVRQLKMLGEYNGDDAIRIIETSIQNDWQGLFPNRTKNVKPMKDYTGI